METSKSNWSNRDWIFISIILVLLQAGIWYVSYIHSPGHNALNYVSFSGTIISIILAIFAIGYTYAESAWEKNKRDGIADQIAILNEVIKNIQIESQSLSSIGKISEELTKLSENFNLGMSKTYETLDGLRSSFENSSKAPIAAPKQDGSAILSWLRANSSPIIKNGLLIFQYVYINKIPVSGNFAAIYPIIDEAIDEHNKKYPKDIIDKASACYVNEGVLGTLRQILIETGLASLKNKLFAPSEDLAKLIQNLESNNTVKYPSNIYHYDLQAILLSRLKENI